MESIKLEENKDYLMQSLSGFRALKLTFNLSPVLRISLGTDDEKGIKWRGGIGRKNLWDIECKNEWQDSDCTCCDKAASCIFFMFFGNSRDRMLPRPYVLQPMLDSKNVYNRGENIILHVCLIGRAADHMYQFIRLMEKLGIEGIGERRSKFYVKDVKASEILFNRLTAEKAAGQEHRIELFTPLKIKEEDRGIYYSGLSFEKFFKLLIKRVINLNNLYCEGKYFDKEEIEHVKNRLVSLAKQVRMDTYTEWIDYEKYSSRQKKFLKTGGQVGIFLLLGDISPFYPYLKLGEYIGVGQNITKGFGRYKIQNVSASER